MADNPIEPPFYPIIYVRGYAGSDDEVEDTVSDPYMGFNLGSTKIRTAWTGDTERYYFESPLVRLMKDFDYRDVYSAGVNFAEIDNVEPGSVPARSIIIYRYYDLVSTSFGDGKQVRMEQFGRGLADLITKLRNRVCGDDAARKAFKVYLVGHSMGGLVIRCFLQNGQVGDPAVASLVDKVFTYATPHNGIELDIIGNVPAFFTHNSADNFNRDRMCEYLGLPPKTKDVNTLDGKFDPDRCFCLIGTNSKDYTVAKGWSARVVGPFSDGLVRINNALVFGPTNDANNPTRLSPHAYVHRSHSGFYGIVNSEEGFQNLTRFLFGDVRIDGELEVRDISLPPDVEQKRKDGRQVRASYHFECIARVRGASWDMSRRVAGENSTIFRRYGELFPEAAGPRDRPNRDRPQLFTAFLSARAKVNPRRKSLGFSIDLGVLVPEYEVDGELFLNNHYPGGYIFRDKLNLEATPPATDADQWQLRYGFDSSTPNRATHAVAAPPAAPSAAAASPAADAPASDVPAAAEVTTAADHVEFRIPIVQKNRPGIDATLVLTARPWNS